MMTTVLRHGVRVGAALTVLLLPIGMRAHQEAAPAKPLVPVAASTLAESTDSYVGQLVTVTGAIEKTFSPSVFSIDQDRGTSTGVAVLVVAPTLSGAVDVNTYVTVIGEVVRLEPDEIAQKHRGYSLDLPSHEIARLRGTPAVLATAVLNTALVDLARRVPPPLTPEEEAFASLMKRVGPAFAAVRQALTDADGAAVKPQADIMRQAFADSAAFWKAKSRADALQWAGEAKSHVEAIARSAAGADWETARTSATSLAQTCSTCHTTYRERLDDGSYRIKGITK
jgi:hypothetical protein